MTSNNKTGSCQSECGSPNSEVLTLVPVCGSSLSCWGLILPCGIEGQLHGPNAQGPHVCQRTIDALLTVSFRGLEGHAQTLPHGPVTTLRCAHPLLVHALRVHIVLPNNVTFLHTF